MTRHLAGAARAAAFVLLAACGGAGTETPATTQAALLVDARTTGAGGFWFLPPVAAEPDDRTPNRRGLAPEVEIEALAPGAGLVAGLGDVKDAGAHYQVEWRAGDAALAPERTYRIRVVLEGVVLGSADARVAADGTELRFLFSGEVFPLTGARTVPIKFRVTAPAPDADGDLVPDAGDGCPTAPDPEQADTDGDGTGDACECLEVVCGPAEVCHAAPACDAATGQCLAAVEPDGAECLAGAEAGSCLAGACVVPPAPEPEAPGEECEGACGCGGCACCGECAGGGGRGGWDRVP